MINTFCPNWRTSKSGKMALHYAEVIDCGKVTVRESFYTKDGNVETCLLDSNGDFYIALDFDIRGHVNSVTNTEAADMIRKCSSLRAI